jgi:hypothetical protein
MEGCGLEVKTFLVMHDTLEALLQSSHRHDRNTVRLEARCNNTVRSWVLHSAMDG